MAEATFNDILSDMGIAPADCLLYRHAGIALEVVEKRVEEGRDHLLSFMTYQTKSDAERMVRRHFCAHFQPVDGNIEQAALLGITETLGAIRRFDFTETEIVEGYVRGEAARHSEEDGERWAIPLRWRAVPEETGALIVSWGPGFRAHLQKADLQPKPVLRWEEATGIAVPEDDRELGDPAEFLESRTMRLHLRLDRKTMPASAVKAARGLVCEGCGIDAAKRFGPDIAARVIEAHHIRPVAELGAGERRTVTVDDFRVLCATCHRIIHARGRPEDMDGLRALVCG